jgi:hypothetical protein
MILKYLSDESLEAVQKTDNRDIDTSIECTTQAKWQLLLSWKQGISNKP